MDEHLRCFDDGLRFTLSWVLHSPIPEAAWLQATLPLQLSGLGLRESVRTAPAAFLASCRSIHSLVAQLLHMDTTLVFHLPGEEVALEMLRQLLPSWDPFPDDITQRFIQDALG